MSSRINNASLTKYPEIFEGTYWNRHAGGWDPVIIENRNRFVEEYNIKRKVNISYKRPLGKKRFESEINPEYPGIPHLITLSFMREKENWDMLRYSVGMLI